MNFTADLIKELVKHSESDTLDVKGDQYAFKGGTPDEKSELLKDIISFANAFNGEDAFVLVGVQERKPPPHKIVGVSTSLDEASLKQFADAKLLVCPEFHYGEVSVEGMTVGVFRIPPQEGGPFFVKRDYGRLKQALVPVRQGTTVLYRSHAAYKQMAVERGRAAFLDPDAGHLTAIIDQVLKSRLVKLQSAADSADKIFDRCSTLLREGDADSAAAEIDRMLADPDRMQQLTHEQRARAHRVKANLLLRKGDTGGAEASLRNADTLAKEDEPRLHALVALHRSGVEEAIRVLGKPKTDDGRQLAAQLLVSAGRPEQAIKILPVDDPAPTSALRPRALAQLMLDDRDGALAAAKELLNREPSWLESHITAGMAHYFSALSPAFKPDQLFSPDIVPPPLFRADPLAFEHLSCAERRFRAALDKTIPAYETLNVELWLLAVLALQSDRREDADKVIDSILSRDPTQTIAVLWAISYSLNFDRETVRQRCFEGLEGDNPLASYVVTYLVLEPNATDESLSFLSQHKQLFDDEGQSDVYDHWFTRLDEEVNGIGSNSQDVTVHGVISQAADQSDWSKVEALISENPDDPIILAMTAEALADAQQWPAVARLAPRLVREIATEFAYRLAATALLNVGDAAECLKVVENWEGRFSQPDLPSVEFWRLRSAALAQLGDVSGAIASVTTLLKKANSPRDISHAAEIYLRVGDVRSAAPHIANLIKEDRISPGDAINWSRAVQHDDQELAEALLVHAARKGVPPTLAGSAYDMAVRLDRDDLSGRFLGDLAAAANQPGTGIQSANADDAIRWMRQRQARAANVNDLYLKGQIPLVMACSETNDNIALRFESAFSAYRSEEWRDALLVYHGSRVEAIEGLPDIAEWVVCLDLTTLLVLDELDILKVLQRSTNCIRLPFELPGALLELEDKLAQAQPGRLAILGEILNAVSTGKFLSGLSNLRKSEEHRVCRVVFEAGDAPDDWPLVGIRDVLEAAVERGHLDPDDAEPVIQSYPSLPAERLQKTIPESPILMFDGNTVEVILQAVRFPSLCAFATCIVDPDYVRIIRGELDLAELRSKALTRVARIRHYISAGAQSNRYTLLPRLNAATASEHSVKSSLDAVLLSLLSHPSEEGCVIAFDDRLLNKHRSTEHNPIICTLDIVEYLRRSGAISDDKNLEIRAQLRDRNLYFALPSAAEVGHALAGSSLVDGVLIESPRAKALRRYVVRLQALQQHLDLQRSDGPPNEAVVAMATFRLAANAIESTYADHDLSLAEAKARANWIWKSIHQAADKRLPMFNRTQASIQYILAVQLGSLLSSAMTTFMVSRRPDREEWMRAHIEWAWEQCILPYLEGNHDLLPKISVYLRECTDPLLDRRDQKATKAEHEEAERFTRAHVSHFVANLPQALQQKVLEDRAFAERFGIDVGTVAEISGVMIEEKEFLRSLIGAAKRRADVPLETKSGPATVRVTRKGPSRRGPIVEFSGSLSVKYEEPILGIIGTHRDENLTKLLKDTDLIDLPSSELNRLQDQCKSLSDEDVYRLLDKYRRLNVQQHYMQLDGSMARREPLRKPDFDAPESSLLFESIRLPSKTRKRFSFLLDLAIESLIEQYDVVEAFDRMCGLPVDLAVRFADPVCELTEKHPKRAKRWLLSPDGSVMGRIHKLAISARLADRGLVSVATVRKAIRGFLHDWPDSAALFVQILRTTDQLQSQNRAIAEMRADQRLAVIWVHAERIARIVGRHLNPGDDGASYFKRIAHRTLASEIRIDRGYETDAASPDVLFAPILLYFGMGYIHGNCDTLISRPLMNRLDELLRITDESGAPLSPRLLQGRANAHDSLESFLKIVNSSFVDQYNAVNGNRAQPSDWFNERLFLIANETIVLPPDRLLWTELLAYEQRWLEPQFRLPLQHLVESIDWQDLLASSEDAAVCVLMLAADMISYLDDESDTVEFGAKLLTASKSASLSMADTLNDENGASPLTFKQAVIEIAYRLSRSSDLARSCRVLAANLRTLTNLDIDVECDIVDMLEIAIPMLPVEHVLPLVELRQSFRTRI